MISLATKRTVLRPWAEEDRGPFVTMCVDPDVMRYIGDGKPKTQAEANDAFDRMQDAWDRDGHGLLVIERLDTGSFAGFTGLLKPDFLPEIMPAVEIGWRLCRDSWGLGLATESAAAALDWAFGTVGLERLVAVIGIDNKRSHRVAEKLGMTRERRTIVPAHGVWADVYELGQQQWPPLLDPTAN